MMRDSTLSEFIEAKNNAKKLFTAGPASLALENIAGYRAMLWPWR